MRHGLCLLLLLLAGCGGEEEARITVLAASSLRGAMSDYAQRFPDAEARLSFAGSDRLAAQLRQGVPADVFASADPTTADALRAEGILEQTFAIASNRVVLAVAKGSRIRSLEDAAAEGVRLGIGGASVPVGRHARRYLEAAGATGRRVLANVRTEEPDVAGVTAKIRAGAVDGGIVYETEVVASRGALELVDLPGAPRPLVKAGVLAGTDNREAARAFLQGLLEGEGREALLRAGFREP